MIKGPINQEEMIVMNFVVETFNVTMLRQILLNYFGQGSGWKDVNMSFTE